MPLGLLRSFLTKDFSGEGFDSGAVLPCVERQSGFAAGLLKKCGPVPCVLDGDLGQQQAAATVPGNEEPVASDFDLFGWDRLGGREDA